MLTAKQSAFCNAVALENQSLSEAYRAVYDTSKCKPETVHRSATQLAKSPMIATRIAELKGKAEAASVRAASYTLDAAMVQAEELRIRAQSMGQLPTAAAMVVHKAKLAGLLVEKREVRQGPLEESDVQELIALRDELRARAAAEKAASGDAPDDHSEGNKPVRQPIH